MRKEPVFYSFHFDNDVFRVQQIRNMGVLAGNQPVTPNQWESVRQQGNAAVERWIADNMKNKRCVVVLIGSQTAERPWVLHEIKKAWLDKRGLLGVYIHNLRCPRTGTCRRGSNPFDSWQVNGQPMSRYVSCYDPNPAGAYREIEGNLQTWVSAAISAAKRR